MVLGKLRGAWQRKQEGKADSEETEGCQEQLSAAQTESNPEDLL